MNQVVTSFHRADSSLIERLQSFGVATVHEAQGRSGLMNPRLRPIYSGRRLAGSAVTVSLPPNDNWMIHVALDICEPGDILVVAPTSECDDGYFGELLACACIASGVKALIIDAGVRDTAELKDMDFPVWSRCVSAQGTVKETLGSVNVPVVCGGAIVSAGDVVLADDDGVCVVKRDMLETVIESSQAREEKEEVARQRLKAGEKSLDVFNLRERLELRGLKYVK